MKASWRKGLSGAVSAIVIAIVLVAGLASASYINLTTARYNEAQMQEALRQARLGSELIRIHIHSTDGAVDSPPRITFVNAWGYESRIIELVVIARNMTPIATIDLRDRPIVLPPGARMTLEPSQIGLSYPTFKRMADELRSIHAYTEAGNSFGSTWGFPREDNMAGRTVATTYNVTTTAIWYVPSLTFINMTFTRSSYITIGPIPPVTNAMIKAINYFKRPAIYFESTSGVEIRGTSSSSWRSSGEPAKPPAPIPGPSFNPVIVSTYNGFCQLRPQYCGDLGNGLYWWWGRGGRGGPVGERGPYVPDVEGPIEIVEGGTYYLIVNGPMRYVQSFTVTVRTAYGQVNAQVTVVYKLEGYTLDPRLSSGNSLADYVRLPPGNYTVKRYYDVEQVYVNAYSPPPPSPPTGPSASGERPTTTAQPPPQSMCDVVKSSGSPPAQTVVGGQKPC
jgi:hypothetical protein